MSYPPDPNSGSADALRQLLKAVLNRTVGAVYLSQADLDAVENMVLETEKEFATEGRLLVVRRGEPRTPIEYVSLETAFPGVEWVVPPTPPQSYVTEDFTTESFEKALAEIRKFPEMKANKIFFLEQGPTLTNDEFDHEITRLGRDAARSLKFSLKKEPTMSTYKHKMNPVDAVLWTGAVDPIEGPTWLVDEIRHGNIVIINVGTDAVSMRISGRNGTRTAIPGDMIVRNDEGEVFPMRVEDFERHYEMVG